MALLWNIRPSFVLAAACVVVPVQLPIVLSSLVSLYFLELTDVLSPAIVGFRCHDRDLSMPYVETGDELIPLLMLLSLAFAGPAASVSPTRLRAHQGITLNAYMYFNIIFNINIGIGTIFYGVRMLLHRVSGRVLIVVPVKTNLACHSVPAWWSLCLASCKQLT